MLEANLNSHKYAFAMPAYDGKVCAETTVSLLETSGNMGLNQISHQFIMIRSGALIDATRNEIVHKFLTETDADTLVCIDSDMVFTWEDMKRLLVFSDSYPIVAGAYTSKTEPPEFIVTVLDNKLNEHGLLPVEALGFGFVAIQRRVLEEMKPFLDEFYMDRFQCNVKAYFRLLIEDSQYIGEDIYFFRKACEAGFQPMIDPYIQLGHVGIKQYNTPFKVVLPQLLAQAKANLGD